MKRILSILMFISVCSVCKAENDGPKDYLKAYYEASGEASLLFRGQEAVKYPYAGAYNGTYFWSSPEFVPGELFYNGKYYPDLLLNVNAHTETLLARQVDGVVAIALDSDLVEWFTMGDDRFVNLKKAGFNVNHNFYQVIYENEAAIYKGVWKTEDTRNVSQSKMMMLEGYNPKLTRAFVPYEEYYWSNGKDIVKLGSKNALINLYPEMKKEIRRVVSNSNLSVEKNLDIYYRRVMSFIETGR